jgi:cyanate permease
LSKRDKLGFLWEMIALFIGAGAGIGPWLGGVIHDLNGDYFWAFSVVQALTFSSVALIWLAASRNDNR